MKKPLDLSLGQRLALGFGLLALILALLAGLVLRWNGESAAAQRAYLERIAPLGDGVVDLERSLLYVAIAARSQRLIPQGSGRQAFDAADGLANASLANVEGLARASGLEDPFRRTEPQVLRYLAEARRFVEIATPDGPTEDSLSRQRERALAGVRELSRRADERSRAAVAAMTAARDKVSRGLAAGGLLALALLALFAALLARSILRPTRELLGAAAALEAGDWQPALRFAAELRAPAVRDELARLGRAFGAAALALESREQRLEAEGQVARAVTASLERQEIAALALGRILPYAGAEVGAVYGWDGRRGTLEPVAGHALSGPLPALRLGEGIPGRAAEQRRPLVVADIPPDTPFRVQLGLAEAPPKSVAAIPVEYRGDLLGVLVLASLRGFEPPVLSFLESAAATLGAGFHNVRTHEEIGRLLEEGLQKSHQIEEQNQELQVQSEEIQAQNEELQAQNEELQAQNEEIQVQSEELRRQHDEIEARNAELLRQSQALRAQAGLLAEADRRKNEFLGVLAHELRNPMAPISNSLHILRRTPPGSEPALRAQSMIERQTRHLLRLIEDLLDVTRISQGKIQIQRERIDLVETLRNCVEDYRPALDDHGLALHVELPPGTVWTEGDSTRLCQIVGNLLSNSIKFTDPGGEVELALRPLPAERQAVIEVRDSGIGIDPALLPKLFQTFRQGKAGESRSNSGLGLGLALVKAFTELHGGSVEARNRDDGTSGTEVVVRLPLLGWETGLAERPAGGWRILIIEDNLYVAQSLREAIELEGHAVEAAYSGPEGLEKARLFVPHVVICDIGLPSMDGYEIARRFRADPALSKVFLIALTGYAAPEDRRKATEAGFDEHLAKPLDIERFNRLLEERSRPQTAPAEPGEGAESG
jgi:signal transduction histidine kinase/ActR/RegA family two-component response regulator/HAMP domain-containing protein